MFSRTCQPKLDNGYTSKQERMSRREWQEPLCTKTETRFSSLQGPPTAVTAGKAGALEGTTATWFSFPVQLGAEHQKRAPPSGLCLGRAYWTEALSWALIIALVSSSYSFLSTLPSHTLPICMSKLELILDHFLSSKHLVLRYWLNWSHIFISAFICSFLYGTVAHHWAP